MEQQRTAVIAHGLLGSVAFLVEAAGQLADGWDGPDDAQALLVKLGEHADHIKGMLHALVRGLPHDAFHC